MNIKQLVKPPLIILGVMILALTLWQFRLLPGELVGLTCILVPAALAGWGGYVVGKYSKPRLSFPTPSATCAACGHAHANEVCECGCLAFVEEQ
jgi:hypothetical protein